MRNSYSVLRIAAAFFILTIASTESRADVTGLRLNFGNFDIQLSLPEDNSDLVNLLLAPSGIVVKLANIIAAQDIEKTAKPIDLTIEIAPIGTEIEATFFSSTINDIDKKYSGGVLQVNDQSKVLQAICDLAQLSGCEEKASATRNALVPKGTQAPKIPFDPSAALVITFGSLPSDESAYQILVPKVDDNKQALDPALQRVPLTDAIQSRKAIFINSLDSPAGIKIATSPIYFIVHCTAFGATDDSIRRWAERNTANKIYSKSHGVILTTGEYVAMWPFATRKVWATKTETCPETSPLALGAAINIEVHYFCATNRNDSPTENQYNALAEIYVGLAKKYGLLAIVSHKEVDRGLKLGHEDPVKFDFSHLYKKISAAGIDANSIKKISDLRNNLRAGPDISHIWVPQLDGPLVLETDREDTCQRDHRN